MRNLFQLILSIIDTPWIRAVKQIYINNDILINIHGIFPHFEFVLPLSWPYDIVSVQRVTNYLCFNWSNSFNFPIVSSHFQTPSLYEISMFSAMIFVNII